MIDQVKENLIFFVPTLEIRRPGRTIASEPVMDDRRRLSADRRRTILSRHPELGGEASSGSGQS